MKLPLINSASKVRTSTSLIQPNKYKIVETDSNKQNEHFKKLLDDIKEIKIHLNKNFSTYDIDEPFIKDLENEYAEQCLIKMEMLPTKFLIRKVLKLRPLEQCDFFLSNETEKNNNNEKLLKVIHIYPSACEANKNKFKNLLKSENNKSFNSPKKPKKNIESLIHIRQEDENKELKEKIASIKKNKKDIDNLIYNKEKIDQILTEGYDNIAELKLYSQKHPVHVVLTPENIRKKYIIVKKLGGEKSSRNGNRVYNCSEKFYNISNFASRQKSVLSDPQYVFDMTSIDNLTDEIIQEVMEPVDIQMELIMKDINYILDNFPLDEFINIDDKNNNVYRYNTESNKDKNLIYKINLDKKDGIVKVCKIFHSMDFYRIVCLTLNLIYWIVFSKDNEIQIDENTKEYLYLKLLSQLREMDNKLSDMKLLYKIFVPLEIIFIRIECDNFYSNKFKKLFENPKNKERIMVIINNLITEIFDKHGYMNTFETVCGQYQKKRAENSPSSSFKSKIFGTSNILEQLFRNDTHNIMSKKVEDIEERQKFIMGAKVGFFNQYLTKANEKLKKRNLEPLFNVNNSTKIPKIQNVENNNNGEEKNKKRRILLSLECKHLANNRYDNQNVAKYIQKCKENLDTEFEQGNRSSDLETQVESKGI